MSKDASRRKFIRQSAAVAAGSALLTALPGSLRAGAGFAPSDQLNIGLIGCRNRGFDVLREHLAAGGVNCVALCDVDENVLNQRSAELQEKHGQKPTLYKDFRKLLDDKQVDAVIIGTPDHWHCLPAVYACEAGKDVYVEKPLANTIAECYLMAAAAKRYIRVVQVGQQQRSGRVWNDVMAYLKSGELGALRKTDIWANFNYGAGTQKVPDSGVPAGVDYEMWLGPAPERPFNQARFHGSWRHFWAYGGGLMTDWGVHLLDMAFWAKEITTPPPTVLAFGDNRGREDMARETFLTMSVVFPFDGYTIQWNHNGGIQKGPFNRNYGLAFICDKGTLVANREGWEVIPEWDGEAKADKTARKTFEETNNQSSLNHARNFIACVKDRKTPACPVETGRAVAVATHMANIAARTGAYRLDWDAAKGRFAHSKAANQLVRPDYRSPWKLPNV